MPQGSAEPTCEFLARRHGAKATTNTCMRPRPVLVRIWCVTFDLSCKAALNGARDGVLPKRDAPEKPKTSHPTSRASFAQDRADQAAIQQTNM